MGRLFPVLAFGFVALVVNVGALESSAGPVAIVNNTNLLTGVYYRIYLDSTPSALTWSGVKTESGENYAQLDDHENRQANYVPGGSEYKDALWYFTPSDQEPPYVYIHNAAYPDELLVADPNLSSPQAADPEDNYAILSKFDTYTSYGEQAGYALWEISPAPTQDQYVIRNFALKKYLKIGQRRDFYKYVVVNGDPREPQSPLNFKLMEVEL